MIRFNLIGYDNNGDKHIGKCCYCSCFLTKKTKTRDHLYPRSKGGKITKPCCKSCNQEKRDMTLSEYITYLFRTPSRFTNIKMKNAIMLREQMYKMGYNS